MNHDTAAPGTDGIETQATHSAELDPEHDCEFCSPPLVTMPPPQTRPALDRPGARQTSPDSAIGEIIT